MKGTEVVSESDEWHEPWQHQCPQPAVHGAFRPKAAVRVNTPGKGSPFTILGGWIPCSISGGCFLATKLVPSPSWRTCHQLLGKEMNN